MFKGRNKPTREFIKSNSVFDKKTGCWDWSVHRQTGGYGQFRYNNHNLLAHRASYAVFSSLYSMSEENEEIRFMKAMEAIRGSLVMHSCDNPSCVNPDHLGLGTNMDNSRDAARKGRLYFQQPHANFWFTRKTRVKKLTDDDVRAIRASREPLAVLSKRFKVSMGNISLIRRGRRKQLVA